MHKKDQIATALWGLLDAGPHGPRPSKCDHRQSKTDAGSVSDLDGRILTCQFVGRSWCVVRYGWIDNFWNFMRLDAVLLDRKIVF